MNDSPDRDWTLIAGGVFEVLVMMAALGLGVWVGVNPLASFSIDFLPVACGVAGAAPLFLLLLISDRLPLKRMQTIKRLLIDLLGRSLDACRSYEVVLLALVVGFCEELMFRGLLQPWIEQHAGYAGGLIWSNVLFGLVHCVTLTYGVLAGLTGAYLGWLLDATGERSLLTPMVTHAVYDYLAFLWIARAYRTRKRAGLCEPETESH